jgi:hypothetical protein
MRCPAACRASTGASIIDEYEPDEEATKEFRALADAVEGLLP